MNSYAREYQREGRRYWNRHVALEQRFAGVTDPEAMGTTGLLAWVIVGPGGLRRDWNRLRKAVGIVRRRGGSVAGFGRALLLDTHNIAQRERFAGYLKSLKVAINP